MLLTHGVSLLDILFHFVSLVNRVSCKPESCSISCCLQWLPITFLVAICGIQCYNFLSWHFASSLNIPCQFYKTRETLNMLTLETKLCVTFSILTFNQKNACCCRIEKTSLVWLVDSFDLNAQKLFLHDMPHNSTSIRSFTAGAHCTVSLVPKSLNNAAP